MSWLRLDDDFLEHPKVIGLSDRELRRWLGVLLYCARFRTRGSIPRGAHRAIGLTKKNTLFFIEQGLLDRDHVGELHVHDWSVYNNKPDGDYTATERKRRQRERDNPVTSPVTSPVTETVSRAQTSARVPVPVPLRGPSGRSVTSGPARDDDRLSLAGERP